MYRQSHTLQVQLPMLKPYGLADVLWNAPPLLPLLSSQDWGALSDCSRQLRHVIYSSVTAITVYSVSDAEAVLRGSWPQLALIKLQPMLCIALSQGLCLPQDSNFQLIASLETVQHEQYEQSSIAFVVCSNCHADHNSVVAAFRHLQTPEMRQAHDLRVTIHSHEVDVIAQIALSDWPSVTSLMLMDNKLGHKSMLHLAKGLWPNLDELDLSSNQLDTAAMTALVQGNWPLLTSLVLKANSSLGPAAVALIPTAAHWASLSKLNLALIQLDSSCTLSIALLHNQLQHLNLSSTGIDAAALLQLTAVPWPQLWRLSLEGNRLNAEAIASLVLAELPELLILDLADNKLSAAAARHIGKSNWCKLLSLSLHNNRFDNSAMAFLAKGNWPNLGVMSLYGNEICVLGFELLMAGQWPQLRRLTLGSYNITAATWTLFDLYDPMPDCRQVSRYFVVLRTVSSISEHVVWPELRRVQFMPDCSSSDVGFASSGQVSHDQYEVEIKPVKSKSTSVGVQCESPPPPMDTIAKSDSDNSDWAGSHWLELMGWSTLAFVAVWVFRPTHDK